MACFAAFLGVIILSRFIDLLAANSCDIHGAVGQSLTLPFFFDGLNKLHVVRWTHNSTIVFYRERGRVSVGKEADVSANGSLLLKNLQPSSAGIYQVKVLHPNGTLAQSWSGQLCVWERISKPQLTYSCDFQSAVVNLNCHVANPQGLVFVWTLDGKPLTSETKQKLSISSAKLKGERRFTCTVANKVSKMESDTIRPACKIPTPPPPPTTLFCYTSKTVKAVLTGGACLILLLLTIIIVQCCCCKRNKAQITQKQELRMVSVSKQEPESISPEYETMLPNEESLAPNPEPSPRACYERVSQPDSKTENRSSHLSPTAEVKKPSPVPKPRTKSPQTPNI